MPCAELSRITLQLIPAAKPGNLFWALKITFITTDGIWLHLAGWDAALGATWGTSIKYHKWGTSLIWHIQLFESTRPPLLTSLLSLDCDEERKLSILREQIALSRENPPWSTRGSRRLSIGASVLFWFEPTENDCRHGAVRSAPSPAGNTHYWQNW